jgi:hypothetical protein
VVCITSQGQQQPRAGPAQGAQSLTSHRPSPQHSASCDLWAMFLSLGHLLVSHGQKECSQGPVFSFVPRNLPCSLRLPNDLMKGGWFQIRPSWRGATAGARGPSEHPGFNLHPGRAEDTVSKQYDEVNRGDVKVRTHNTTGSYT